MKKQQSNVMKIVIIGSGLMGVTSAYFLAKAGYEVEVLERQGGPALETSFANAGMLTPSMADPWNSPEIFSTLLSSLTNSHSSFALRLKALPSLIGWGLSFLNHSQQKLYFKNLHRSADLACYSMKVLEGLNDELDIRYDYIATGSLKIFRNQSSLEKLAELSKQLYEHDMSFKVVKGDDLTAVEPSLEPVASQLCGGVYFPDDQAGNAYKFTCEMESAAKKHGAKFRYNVSVSELVRRGSNIAVVKSSAEDIAADKIILAAGSYSYPLAKTAGLTVPVRPAKGYSLSIPFNGWNGGPSMPVNDDDFHLAITPMGDVLRIAGTAEFAGYDLKLRRQNLDSLYNLVHEIYPSIKPYIDRTQVKEWTGLRPLTVDGSPFIGKTRIENLYVNTGHGPLGWTMASGSSKMLCDIIKGDETALAQEEYSLSRF